METLLGIGFVGGILVTIIGAVALFKLIDYIWLD